MWYKSQDISLKIMGGGWFAVLKFIIAFRHFVFGFFIFEKCKSPVLLKNIHCSTKRIEVYFVHKGVIHISADAKVAQF